MFKLTIQPLEISATIARGNPNSAIPMLFTRRLAISTLLDPETSRERIKITSATPLTTVPNTSKKESQTAVIISNHLGELVGFFKSNLTSEKDEFILLSTGVFLAAS